MKMSHTPIGEKCQPWDSTVIFFLTVAIGTMLLFIVLPQNGWAEEHVITMYFGGTSMPEDGYLGENVVFKQPALIAKLHHEQEIDDNHHKIIIAGVSAKPDCSGLLENIGIGFLPKFLEDLVDLPVQTMQKAIPHMDLCRNWADTIIEAEIKLRDKIFPPPDQTIFQDGDTMTLNVIGHSRGAIAAIWFLGKDMDDNGLLDWLIKEGILTKINLITLDPVPGVDMLKSKYGDVHTIGWDNFRLDERLTKFVAIYAYDERCNKFSGLVPYIPPTVDSQMFSVRGSHQTMVGSLKKGGHSPLSYAGFCDRIFMSNCDESIDHQSLKVIPDLVANIILELLSGPGWGGVQFDSLWSLNTLWEKHFDSVPGSKYGSRELAFLGGIENMNYVNPDNPISGLNHIYQMIRGSAYFPGPPTPLEAFVDGSCQRSVSDIGTRCMTRVNRGFNLNPDHVEGGIKPELGMPDIPLLGYNIAGSFAWTKIVEMGMSADDDDDGVPSEIDSCPGTAAGDDVDSNGCSDSQVDSDNDGFCNEDAPSYGPSECTATDNCPDDPNPGQEDSDGDWTGDVCDSDVDGDGILNISDNCPDDPNPGQEDFDGDGTGDVCDSDTDGDGIANDSDVCSETAIGALVDPEAGCSIAQLCPCEGPLDSNEYWRNKGKYIYCIAKTSKNFVKLGLLSKREKKAIVFEAKQSSCGEK